MTTSNRNFHALPRTLSDDHFEGAPSRYKSWLVSFICLTGAALGGYTLYLDLNEVGHGGLGQSVGRVQKREHKVRRKSSSSFVWTQILPGEDLYRKDSVQTGEDSAASISLSDGTSLDIGESSLVVMDDTTELALGFIRGTVVVHKAEGDTKISVDQEGKRKVEELPARLLKPESLAHYFISGPTQKKIEFKWDIKSVQPVKSGTANREVLEFSTHRKFTPETTRRVVALAGSHTATLDVGAGTYFWRVQTLSGEQAELHNSDVRLIRLSSVDAVQTIYPNEGQSISVTGADPEIQFRWLTPKSSVEGSQDASQDGSVGEHVLEVAKTGDFVNPVSTTTIRIANGLAGLRGLPEGKLFWRIRSRYHDLQLISGAHGFDFYAVPVEAPVVPMPFPVTAQPVSGATLNLMDEKNPPQAQWSVIPEAKEYEVTLLQGAKEISKVKVKEAAISLKNLKPGDYTWTVRGIGEKRIGEPLPIRSFKMTYGEPLAAPHVMSSEVQ